MTSATDVDNGVSVATEYDAVGRPVKVRNAAGTALESWTRTEYDDVARRVIVRGDLEAVGDGRRVAIQHFDQLGRVRLSRTLENSATEDPYNETHGIKVQTRYGFNDPTPLDPTDPQNTLGSYVLTSNPYRAATAALAGGEATMGWTRSIAVNTGRHAETETFSGAAMPAPWGGNTSSMGVVLTDSDAHAVTVTDQAGKKRRQLADALGRTFRVDEPDAAGNLGTVTSPVQPTYYSYDTLNNLTTVTQGVQIRTFAYSSLSRLLSAANPESGTISYLYDAGGNLTAKTDARGITTAYAYDALNRVTLRDYSDTTPDVTYTYDDGSVPFSKGRLTKVSSSVSATEYTAFDILGRVLSHRQTTDGQIYTTAYAYNLSGAMIEETYPSGRKVRNTLDADGDLSMVETQKAGGVFQIRADNFVYNSAGAATSLRLGNGKFESTQFNSKLQPIQIGLGNSATDTSLLKLNYDYGTTANNGNVLSQTITVPTVGANPGFTAVQTYTYDSLNRLKSATEMIGATQTWKQTFTFDRYGNRNFDQANTTYPTSFAQPNITNPAVNQANNRFAAGQGYSYDNSGNTTADANGQTFVYDAENKQTQVNGPGGVLGQYWYDGDGKRVKKIVPATNETTVFVYDANGQLVAEYSTTFSSTPGVKYLTQDHLGTPRIITDQNGNVVSRHDYHPYGEEVLTAQRTQGLGYNAADIRQKFTTYERDSEIDLDFAQARIYTYTNGRFSTPDPIFESIESELPQSLNRYVYTLNNPLVFIDPDGELWIVVHGNQTPQWVDKCPEGEFCFTAVAFKNENGGLNVYGSNGADDITEFGANKDGQIDVRALSQHHDAQFVVAGGQAVPEEFLSVDASGTLFNIAKLYSQKFTNDEKLVFTAGNARNGKPGICDGKPCHGGHKGNDIDLRYMGLDGKPLQGGTAYKSADINRTNWLISVGEIFGYPYSYTGDDTRFGRPDRSPKYRDGTEKVHRHHLHIGKTAPRKKK